jgi:hypothetical protein
MTKLLTETADYDTPGSWGTASNGWPAIRGDKAYDMYVFACCVQSIPYGSYVLMDQRGRYGATESILRVHSEHERQLESDFRECGKPSAEVSMARRERYGEKDSWGLRMAVPKWKEGECSN